LAEKVQMFKVMNKVRQQPKWIIPDLMKMKTLFKGNVMNKPGQIGMETEEGWNGVQILIEFLNSVEPIGPMKWSNGLSKACQDFMEWQGPRGGTGHTGPSPSESPWDRFSKLGKWSGSVAENISYGSKDGKESMIQLMIDDGVPSRGHRNNIFNPKFKIFGIGIGPHQKYNFATCTAFAGGFSSSIDAKPWVTCENCVSTAEVKKPVKTKTPKPSVSKGGSTSGGSGNNTSGGWGNDSNDGWGNNNSGGWGNTSSSSGDWSNDSWRRRLHKNKKVNSGSA